MEPVQYFPEKVHKRILPSMVADFHEIGVNKVIPMRNIRTRTLSVSDTNVVKVVSQKKEGKRPEQQYFRPGKRKSEGSERVRSTAERKQRTPTDNKRVNIEDKDRKQPKPHTIKGVSSDSDDTENQRTPPVIKCVSNDINNRNQRITINKRQNIDTKERTTRKASDNKRVNKDFEHKENRSRIEKSRELTRVRSVLREYSGINCENRTFINTQQTSLKQKHQVKNTQPTHNQEIIEIESDDEDETVYTEPLTKDNFIVSYSLPLEHILSYLDAPSLRSYMRAINTHYHLLKILDDRLGVHNLIYPWISETRVLPSADGTCNKELFEVNRWREMVCCNLPSSVTSMCICDTCICWKIPKNCRTEDLHPEVFVTTWAHRRHQRMTLIKAQ